MIFILNGLLSQNASGFETNRSVPETALITRPIRAKRYIVFNAASGTADARPSILKLIISTMPATIAIPTACALRIMG